MFTITLLALSHAAEAPEVPDGFVFRPRFVTEAQTYQAGTAFAVKQGERTLVVTAVHLFGPAGGLAEQIPATELPAKVSQAKLKGLWTEKPVAGGQTGPALLIEGAAPMGETAANDVAAFQWTSGTEFVVPTGREITIRPGVLAETAAKKGDEVFVAASPPNGAPDGQRAHKAVVVEANDGFVFFQYANPGLDLTATSGAPILNAAGEVVGINLGGGQMEGDLIGSGAPIMAIKKHLQAAK